MKNNIHYSHDCITLSHTRKCLKHINLVQPKKKQQLYPKKKRALSCLLSLVLNRKNLKFQVCICKVQNLKLWVSGLQFHRHKLCQMPQDIVRLEEGLSKRRLLSQNHVLVFRRVKNHLRPPLVSFFFSIQQSKAEKTLRIAASQLILDFYNISATWLLNIVILR